MVGQNIGKYRVLERIGRGGMGTVYRAIDETLHRDVAIKVLNAELNDPEVAKRFRAEAITVARLSHPGIATIYELFQSDGQWLMVMEFVRGETLEHLVERMGPLSPQRTAEISMQALGALAHAHSMGVVHRDLKPANIMITDTGIVKIMDFGIARVAGTEHLTNAGFMMGTPAYMAPEQVLGRDIDARADIYAMGVVFYRLTTSKLPFKGDTPFAMAQSQVNDPPTPIGLVRSDLPPWVEEVTSRALSKSPDQRFQSAVDFHESLARCLSGLPIGPLGATASAPTELLMTPPRAMPTGSIRSTLPPLTGAPPPPSGAQPVVIPSSAMPTAAAPAPSTSAEFDASAATMLSPSPSGPVPMTGPPSGPVIAQISTSGALASSAADAVTMPIASPTSEARAVMAPTPTAGIPVVKAGSTASVPPASSAIASAPMAPVSAPAPPVPPATAKDAKKSSSIGLVAAIGAVVVIGGAAGFWFKSRSPSEPPAVEAPAAQAVAPAPSEAATPAMDAPNSATAAPTPVTAAPAAPDASLGARATSAGRAGTTAAAPGRSTAAAAATAATTTAPAPVVEDTPVSFDRARILVVSGRKTDDQEIMLWFANGHINAIAKKGEKSLGALPYGSVAGATYLRAKDPKWDAALASPPSNLDVGGVLRGDKNWLVVQGRDNYLIFRLDDSNSRAVLDALASKTNVTISYPKK